MSGSQPPSPRGRKRKEPSLQSDTTPKSKKQRRRHPSAFYDGLSKIWLTKDALRELDWRNDSSIPQYLHTHRLTRRPVTRNFHAYLFHKPASRTSKAITCLAEEGGPDISDLRGFPAPDHPLDQKMSQSSSRSRQPKRRSDASSISRRTTHSTRTKDSASSGAYSANFQQKCVDGGILPHGYMFPDGRVPPKPPNWEAINQRLAQRRPSLSPFPEERFEEFVQADARANNEDQVKDSVMPKLLAVGGAQRNIRFTNLAPLDGFKDDELKKAQPDYYFGAPPETLPPEIRNELSKHIVPSTSTHLPIAPNYFIEAKGPDGSLAVATRQACYDGAHGARAMQSLRSFRQSEPEYDNVAHTLSTIYHGGQVKIFSHSVAQPNGPGTLPVISMHQQRSFALTDSEPSHVQGLTAVRNAADWAEEERNAGIMLARERASQGAADNEGGIDEYAEEETEVEVEDDCEESSSTMPSFSEVRTMSSLLDGDSDGSESSVDELQCVPDELYPRKKRALSNSRHHHGKRKAGGRRSCGG